MEHQARPEKIYTKKKQITIGIACDSASGIQKFRNIINIHRDSLPIVSFQDD